MSNPILQITDGDTYINLLAKTSVGGILLKDWTPAIAPLKSGGVYQQGVMSDGRQLVMTNYENAIETMNLVIRGTSQDTAIWASQELMRLLNKARAYWTTSFATEPVYIVARAPDETNTRYAIIHNYQLANLDNPYAMPFFHCDPSTMDDITVVFERGHWQATPPGMADCVEITSYSDSQITKLQELVTQSSDDCYVDHVAMSINTSAASMPLGRDSSSPAWWYEQGVRFSSVDMPEDAEIVSAALRFEISDYSSKGVSWNYYDGPRIYCKGETSYTYPTFTTYVDFADFRGPYTMALSYLKPYNWKPGQAATFDVKEIVEEIIAWRNDWVNGDPMVFFIAGEEPDSGKELITYLSSYDNSTYDEPRLTIQYIVPRGQTEATCTDAMVISDRTNYYMSLSHIYVDDGGVFGSNLISSTDVDLFPSTPASGDHLYIGSSTQPFSNVVFNIETAQNSARTFTWEYYSSGGWATMPVYVDETDSLMALGIRVLSFPMFEDYSSTGEWTATTINGTQAFWIRATITSGGAGPVAHQGDTAIYTNSWGNITIPEDNVVGDIPASGSINLLGVGIGSSGLLSRDRVILALSSDRGPYYGSSYDFSAFIPFLSGAAYLPVGVIDIDYSDTTIGSWSESPQKSAPTYYSLLLSPSGSGTTFIFHTLDSSQFFGRYRVFIRVRQEGGSANDFFIQIKTQHGSTIYAETDEVPVSLTSSGTSPNWQLLDLGEISIPTGLPARMAEENVELDMYTYVRCEDNTGDINLGDIILMPSDEWIADVKDFGSGNWSENSLYVDSIYVPKKDIRALTRDNDEEFKNPVPFKIIGQSLTLPANKKAKLWFLSARKSGDYWISDAGATAKLQLFKSERYLGLRGTR